MEHFEDGKDEVHEPELEDCKTLEFLVTLGGLIPFLPTVFSNGLNF